MANLQPLNAPNRRQADRRSALDDYLCLVDLGDSRSAMLLDVSETGIGVQSVEGVAEGLSTRFRFQLPDTAVLVEGEGEIAWADRAGRMGVRFTTIADELKPELRHWVVSEANPLFAHQPVTEEIADLDARDRVAQLEARIIVSGWAQVQALNFLVDQIAAMTQASGVAIAVEDGRGIVCKASSGIAPQVGVTVTPRSGLSWECVRTKEVVTCADTENDPRVDRIVCRELNMRSAMLVPVMKDGGVAGLVEVFSSRPHAFSNQTVILLRRVAEAVASLDETAPAGSEDSVLQMPVRGPEVAPVAIAPVMPERVAKPVEEAKAPFRVAAPAAVQAAPPPVASVAKPPAPVSAPAQVVQKPAPAAPMVQVATVPVAPAVRPTAAPVVAPPATTIGIPFAQEVAKPAAAAPAPVKQPEKPAVVAAAATGAAVATKMAEVAPAASPVVPKPVEKIVPDKVAPVAKPEPVLPPPAIPAQAERPAAKAVVARIEIPLPPAKEQAPTVSKIVSEPAPKIPPAAKPLPVSTARVPAQSAPLPAVAFSGAAASAATRMFEVPHTPATSPAGNEEARREVAFADSIEIESATSDFSPARAARNRQIAIAAGVMVVLLAAGGWYGLRTTARPSAAAAPPIATVPSANTQPASLLPAATAVAPPASAPVATKAAVLPKQPEKSTPAVAKKNESGGPVSDSSQPAATQPTATAAEPITARTFVPAPEQPVPQAPSLPVASPNTAGMASLLAAPIANPILSRTMISQGVTGGKQIARVQPVYPATARALRLSGTVTMTAHISQKGTVTAVKIITGHPLLNAAALAAVKQWKYDPFRLNGQPIENDINVQVRFEMPR